jgi:hypothetical protein
LRRRSSRLSRQEIHRHSWNSWDWLQFKCHPGHEWNVWDGSEYFWCKYETKQVTAKPITLCYSKCSNPGAEAAGVLRTPKLWNVFRRFEIWLWKNSVFGLMWNWCQPKCFTGHAMWCYNTLVDFLKPLWSFLPGYGVPDIRYLFCAILRFYSEIFHTSLWISFLKILKNSTKLGTDFCIWQQNLHCLP